MVKKSHGRALQALVARESEARRPFGTIALLISEHEYDVEPGSIAVSGSRRRCGWRLRGRGPHENRATQRSRCGPRGCGQAFASVRSPPSDRCALVQCSHSLCGGPPEAALL